jgi:hypothetical protein
MKTGRCGDDNRRGNGYACLTISVMLSKRGVYGTSLFLPQRIEPIEVFPMVWLTVLHLKV